MLTAKQYAIVQPIMCNKYPLCVGCPLANFAKKNNYNNCFVARVMRPTACVNLVAEWWNEHKSDVFYEYNKLKELQGGDTVCQQ